MPQPSLIASNGLVPAPTRAPRRTPPGARDASATYLDLTPRHLSELPLKHNNAVDEGATPASDDASSAGWSSSEEDVEDVQPPWRDGEDTLLAQLAQQFNAQQSKEPANP
eukprot:4536837-Prymnesium_polylepis.1